MVACLAPQDGLYLAFGNHPKNPCALVHYISFFKLPYIVYLLFGGEERKKKKRRKKKLDKGEEMFKNLRRDNNSTTAEFASYRPNLPITIGK